MIAIVVVTTLVCRLYASLTADGVGVVIAITNWVVFAFSLPLYIKARGSVKGAVLLYRC